jgi:hypothetical protein
MTDCFCCLASTNLLLSCLFSFGNVFEVNTLSREVASGGWFLTADRRDQERKLPLPLL